MQAVALNFVDVILPLPLERNFTYAITAAEAQFVKAGFRVAVPFGKRKVYTGIVFKFMSKRPPPMKQNRFIVFWIMRPL